ncbi:glycosyltransferase family 1 protein, partial [Candidatus Bathyarchaeota archaeon]
IKRCYEEVAPDSTGGAIDKEAILSEEFDCLIIEPYASLPYKAIEEIFPELKKKGKVIAVIHEGRRKDIKYSLDNFDRVVVFDERYKKMLGKSAKVEIVPYPCNPVVKSDRRFAEDGLKFLTFGRQPSYEYYDYIEALDDLSKRYDFTYKVIRSDGLIPFKRPWLVQERRRIDDVYPVLHSADLHLIPKRQTSYVVVSSTLCQCLGALVPTVVPDTRHFETLPEIEGVKPAIVYKDVDDLKEKIERVIEDEDYRRKVLRAAEKYVEENRSDKIAQTFLRLLDSI